MNNAVASGLMAALTQLETTVKAGSAASPKPDLQWLFLRIDELAASLPRDTDPTLLHYLHKKSYVKARRYLQDRAGENQTGNCRHGCHVAA